MTDPFLRLQAVGLAKSFAGVRALDNVSLDLRAGEVHVLMGENGAGKSTLVHLLAGLLQPDSGRVTVNGETRNLPTPHAALRRGLVLIHQELMPVPDMTVAENLLLGREPTGRVPGLIDRRALRQEAARLLRLLEADLPLDQPLGTLSVAAQQTVEIARALGWDAQVLMLDEPTAALSDREVHALFKVVQRLKKRGVAILLITHKMQDVFRLADRITVLRDGRHVMTAPADELDEDTLVQHMVGRPLVPSTAKRVPARDDEALAVRGLCRAGVFKEVSFTVRRGEVVGLAGLMGAGRTEVLETLFGLAPAEAGEIRVGGRPVRLRSPSDALQAGLALVTEDRRGSGIVPALSVAKNLTLASLARCGRGPWLNLRAERRLAESRIGALGIKSAGPTQPIRELSGGNQQKTLLGRTLLTEPEVLLLDEPTRGIDVGAKAEIYEAIIRLASEGKAVLVASSELPELLLLCHRILVMRQGEVTLERDAAQATQEELIQHAMPR